jgi:uncharacterized protein YkwD
MFSGWNNYSKFARMFLLLLFFSLPGIMGCGTDIGALYDDITDSNQVAQEVFDLTNEERVNAGLEELTWNDNLAQAAEDHCQDMIDRDYFDHYTPEGLSPGDRATAAGYEWLWIGENIAAGYASAEDVMVGWMNSEEHKENILRTQFTELGVGLRVSWSGRVYWAQEFGTPLSSE